MRLTRPRVAVIVPAYNEERWLAVCLRSLRQQRTTATLEIIVVDNGSTDQTSDVALAAADQVLRCDQRGRLNSIRHALTATADADVIAFADADTQYPATWIECILTAFEKDEVQLVFGPSTQGLSQGHVLTLVLYLYRLWVMISLRRGVVCSVGFNMAARPSAVAAVVRDLASVALNDWALGTAILRRYSRESVQYVHSLIVPKCMRRYQANGWWQTTLLAAREWLRLMSGRGLAVGEHEYHGF